MKRILNWIKETSLFERICCIIIVLEVIALFKFRWTIGMGDSMLPTLKNPSFTICMITDNYEVGDIVHYNIGGFPIIHRIVQIETYMMENGYPIKVYTLQGDNNPEADHFKVYDENIKCKVLFVK